MLILGREPVQCAEYLGPKINPLPYRVTVRGDDGNFHTVSLPFSAGESSIVQPGPSLPLMASLISVVCLLLIMKDFQCWVTTLPWQSP